MNMVCRPLGSAVVSHEPGERCRLVLRQTLVQQAIYSVIQRSNNLIRYTVNIQKDFLAAFIV
jgi:hypothetical protein